MYDLYVSWEPELIFKATGEVWGWSSILNVYIRIEIKADIVYIYIYILLNQYVNMLVLYKNLFTSIGNATGKYHGRS